MSFDRRTKLVIGLLLLAGGCLSAIAMFNWHDFGASVGGRLADTLLAVALVTATVLGFLLIRANWRPQGRQR